MEIGAEPLYLRPSGPGPNPPGLISDYYVNGIDYRLRIFARMPNGLDGAELQSPAALVRQSQAYGGRTYEVPSTWVETDTALIAASTAKDTWTFYI